MTDFTRWLYAHYIKPQLDTADIQGYEQPLSSIRTELTEWQQADLDRTLEFYAANAFLLGLRTGAGLVQAGGHSSQSSLGSVQSSI